MYNVSGIIVQAAQLSPYHNTYKLFRAIKYVQRVIKSYNKNKNSGLYYEVSLLNYGGMEYITLGGTVSVQCSWAKNLYYLSSIITCKKTINMSQAPYTHTHTQYICMTQ